MVGHPDASGVYPTCPIARQVGATLAESICDDPGCAGPGRCVLNDPAKLERWKRERERRQPGYVPLGEREKAFVASMGPEDRAKRAAQKMRELAEETRADTQYKGAAAQELGELAAVRMEEAAEMLRVMSLEQFRQRETMRHYLDGRVDRDFMRGVARTWNDDPVTPARGEK